MTETTFTALFLHILIKPSHVNTTLCFPNYIMMSKPKKHSKRFISLCIYVFYYKWVRINPWRMTQKPYKNEEKKCCVSLVINKW